MEHILLNPELKQLKRNVSSFVKEYVRVAEQREGSEAGKLPIETLSQLQSKAKEMGLWFLGAKQEWGGSGLSLFEQVVLLEEAAQHRLGLFSPAAGAFGQEFPSILENCTQEQIEKYVKPSIRKGNGCFVALWETHESSNLDNLECKAVQKGNQWVIDGMKDYVTHAPLADFGIVLVNCITEDGKEHPTLFIVDHDHSFEIEEKRLIDVLPSYQLKFEHCIVENHQRIGEMGEGIILIRKWLTESQVLMAARCIGIAKKAHEITRNYVSLRITRGKALAEFPSIRSDLVQTAAELQAARWLVWDAALKLNHHMRDGKKIAGMAKIVASQTASKIVDMGLQFHGGAGFTRDVPFERWYKELRITRLIYGSKETLHQEIFMDLFNG